MSEETAAVAVLRPDRQGSSETEELGHVNSEPAIVGDLSLQEQRAGDMAEGGVGTVQSTL